ncbi:hypothetical protein KAR91_58405 [Candidatus Pacearchaeota archaeon]|nr:hypothetical protein [Candidatus Pacearchaeota archaeon]
MKTQRRNERGEFEPIEFGDIEIGDVFVYGRWHNHLIADSGPDAWNRWYSRSIYRRGWYYKNKKDSAIFLADDWNTTFGNGYNEYENPGEEFYFQDHVFVDRVKKHIRERWTCNG